jgi:murein DD-endopeptidase MepM/ murein hydrolase activator NlpD
VRRGDQIATIGNAFGQWAYHLHFDLSPTTILETQPQHWPGRNLAGVLSNYVDPRLFIEQNRP